MSVKGKEYQCSACGYHFVFEYAGEDAQATQGYGQKIRCPHCREIIEHKRGSGRDEGQSNRLHGPCFQCGSETEYFRLPGGEHTTCCSQCARGYSSSSY